MRLIDADDAKRTYTQDMFDTEEDFERVNDVLDYAPAADVVEVVRCKDCKYFGRELENGKHDCTDFNLPYCRPDDFCSYGVQKEATSTDE